MLLYNSLRSKSFICRKIEILKYLTFVKQNFFPTVEYKGRGIIQIIGLVGVLNKCKRPYFEIKKKFLSSRPHFVSMLKRTTKKLNNNN